MKRIFSLLFVLSLTVLHTAFAQKPFNEGTLTFSMKASSDNSQAAAMLNGATMTIFVKGDHVRQEMNFSGGAMQNTSIADLSNKTTVVLINAMGQKKMMKLTQDQVDKMRQIPTDYKIEYSGDSTKTILGYTCKKAIVHVKGGNDLVFWVTDELVPANTEWSHISGLKGLPLQFNMTQRGTSMTLTATKIDLSSVSDDEFKIPDGYDEVKPEDMMGGGKQ